MGKLFQEIDESLRQFIEAQQMFFVATAPLDAAGHVNLSPKGLDTLRVVDSTTIAYLDFVGSGAETIAHVTENGRVVVMLCAMQGPPRIVRFHGRGRVVEPGGADFPRFRALFPDASGVRAIIVVAVERISDSCGFGVPLFTFEQQRPQLVAWADRKGEEALLKYQHEKNARSIDGLRAVTWVPPQDSAL